MEKFNGESLDLVKDKIEKLKEIFPEVFSEGKIDFDGLKELLGEVVETDKERYNFNWFGKSEAKAIALEQSKGTLIPDKESSKNWGTTENLYIEGDNLEVLKLLQKSYYNKIKMVYIDPPYNTGKDFVYPDNYKDNLKNYLQLTGQINAEGQKLSTNADTSGRYHSNWLNMMYPRLKLARNLLTDDGVIFISIDDNEQENLKKICNEIFGEENFVAQVSWRRSDNQSNIGNFARVKEYIILFCKDKNNFSLNKLPLTEKAKNEYRYSDEKGRFRRKILLDKTRGRHIYDITTKSGNVLNGPWMLKKEEFAQLNEENGIYWTSGGDEQPYGKIYMEDSRGQIPNDFWGIEFGTNQRASGDLEALFDFRSFDFSKPISLLETIAIIGTNDGSVILDFFSGSATTAHATMHYNAVSENGGGGGRKFIMVQLPEPTDEKSEAYKSGYKNICEIGKERIRRAGQNILEDESIPKKNRENLDVGFKVFKLESSNIKEWNSNVDDLYSYVNNIKSDRTSLDVVYEILLKYGINLNVPIEERKGFYVVGNGSIYIGLGDQITEEIINSICEEYKKIIKNDKEFKTMVVLKDTAFKNSSDKTNFIQILKQVGIGNIKSI